MVKNLPVNAEDTRDASLNPGSGRSSGEESSNPLLYSCLGNLMNRGVWWATVHGVAELDMTEQLTNQVNWVKPQEGLGHSEGHSVATGVGHCPLSVHLYLLQMLHDLPSLYGLLLGHPAQLLSPLTGTLAAGWPPWACPHPGGCSSFSGSPPPLHSGP